MFVNKVLSLFLPDAVTLFINTEQQQPLLGHPDDKGGAAAEERSTHPVNEGSTHPDEQGSPPAVGEQALINNIFQIVMP